MSSTDSKIRYRYRGKSNSIFVRGPHDYATFFEVFCRRDYAITKLGMIVVDIGSNIGISARFFLESGARFIYLYEPDPENLDFLRRNIANFGDTYRLEEKAVSISQSQGGTSAFEVEKTGRYGRLVSDKSIDVGISSNRIKVQVLGIEDVLGSVLLNFENIDVLKIDIEGLELEIVKAIPPHHLAKIKMIQYETWPEGIVTLKPA
jgi:FkbM family methyltransferase